MKRALILVQKTQLEPISSNSERPCRIKQKFRDFLKVDLCPEWLDTSVWIQSAREYASGDHLSTTGVKRLMFWAATDSIFFMFADIMYRLLSNIRLLWNSMPPNRNMSRWILSGLVNLSTWSVALAYR